MSFKSLGFQAVVAFGLSATLVACSGSGSRVEGNQCRKGFEPVQMNIHPASKLAMKPETLPDGEYVLTRAALHFKGDPTPQAPDGFQVLIKDEVPKHAKESTLVTHADCFRNANVSQSYAATVPGLESVVIKDGKVVRSSAKDFGFTMSDDGKFELTGGVSRRKAEAPQDLFKDAAETFVVRWTDFDYEIRTKGRAYNGDYALTTFLHRQP
jgi:hypothetical protein